MRFSVRMLIGLKDEYVSGYPMDRASKGKFMSAATKGMEIVDISWDIKELDKYFVGPYVCSANLYRDGYRDGNHWIATGCIIIDFDDGTPVGKVIDVLRGAGYKYYITFSMNSSPVKQKYHVVMPLREEVDDKNVLIFLKEYFEEHLFAGIGGHPDSSVTCDASRGVIRGQSIIPREFCDDGRAVDPEEIYESLKASLIFKGVTDPKSSETFRLGWGDLLPTRRFGTISVREAYDLILAGECSKVEYTCPVCDRIGDREGTGVNAFFSAGRDNKSPFGHCSSCKSRKRGNGGRGSYFLNDEEAAELASEDFIVVGKTLYRLKDGCFEESDIDALPMELPAHRTEMLHRLKMGNIASKNFHFLIEHSPKHTKRFATLERKDLCGYLTQYEPRGEVIDEDDGSCELWLKAVFGEYWEFVRDWIIVYGWWDGPNIKLPVFVFGGHPGAGKTSFSQIVASLYPYSCDMAVDKLSGDFKPWSINKLIAVDESDLLEDKYKAFKELKKVVGSDTLGWSDKYEKKRQVANKVNVIVITNDTKVIHIPIEERATSNKSNKFFIFMGKRELPEEYRYLVGNARRMIVDYIFNKCESRWEELKAEIDMRDSTGVRFCLKTPITADQVDQEDQGEEQIDFDLDLFMNELYNHKNVVGIDLSRMSVKWINTQVAWMPGMAGKTHKLLKAAKQKKYLESFTSNGTYYRFTEKGLKRFQWKDVEVNMEAKEK